MKVYYHGRSTNHTLHVQPGLDEVFKNEWKEKDGRAKYFEVRFINGVADVEDALGRYLIDKNLASKSPIITEAA